MTHWPSLSFGEFVLFVLSGVHSEPDFSSHVKVKDSTDLLLKAGVSGLILDYQATELKKKKKDCIAVN